ncbi:hypothetical protein OV208_15200 [Corallococcus sp. bb12-1]|uniref:hypothetical protein n=1 Tax=Corallococcus sp. bb12-1 TaxID=2996784 RepID=UPI00226DF39C|nr:hypothetical protein [Corallococcus sp. bb12-1]MCY1042671.1 hypothetical protein [Corallococcus sp. bb12-1]
MRCRRPRTPSPEVQQHRANRQEYFRDLDKLKGTAEPTPPPSARPAPDGYCHCGAPFLRGKHGLFCGWGLHDG